MCASLYHPCERASQKYLEITLHHRQSSNYKKTLDVSIARGAQVALTLTLTTLDDRLISACRGTKVRGKVLLHLAAACVINRDEQLRAVLCRTPYRPSHRVGEIVIITSIQGHQVHSLVIHSQGSQLSKELGIIFMRNHGKLDPPSLVSRYVPQHVLEYSNSRVRM